MKERKTPEDILSEHMVSPNCERVPKASGGWAIGAMKEYASQEAEIAWQEGYNEGYKKGRKEILDNITPEGLVETAKADGFADGYRLGVKEEVDRHSKLVEFARYFCTPEGSYSGFLAAKEALIAGGYLEKEEQQKW